MEYLNILVKLRRIIRSINLESKRIEKKLGVSIPQLLILQYLSKQNDFKASASQIKDYIKLNASTVSGIIKRLEAKGHVYRKPKLNDKRSKYVTLTAKGVSLLEKAPTTLQEKLSKKLDDLSDNEINDLHNNIDLLIQLMEVENLDASPVITINILDEGIK